MNASIVNVYLQEMDKNILWAENSPKQDVGCCSCGDLMSQRVACPFILFMLIFMFFFFLVSGIVVYSLSPVKCGQFEILRYYKVLP